MIQTAETINLLKRLDETIDELVESAYNGLCETMSPNDPEFESTLYELVEDIECKIAIIMNQDARV